MPDHGSQTIRRRRLAAELRRLRERAGLTGDEAADQLGWSASKISRIETHRIGVKPADLRRLLDLYDVDVLHREELQAFAQESTRSSKLESVAAGLPADLADQVYAEQEASSIWTWNPLVIPGLLQTEAYAGGVLAGYQVMFRLAPVGGDRRIELRRMRQQVLTRDPPVELSAVIDESVLYRKYGDHAIMRQQLLQLAETSTLSNVEVRVLALAGAHPLGTGAFSYMQFRQVHDVPLNDIVTVEHLTGNEYMEDEQQTHRYRVSFESLVEHALDVTRSRDLIRAAASDVWE
jgi:transcriptional regulator with XRE-family HTH domain